MLAQNSLLTAVAPESLAAASVAPVDGYVLLVDDHEPTLRRLHEVLTGLGYPCIAARSPTEALCWCDRRRPSVVVTDLMMPSLDGCALSRWLRARYPRIPLILVTGQDLDDGTLAHLHRTFRAVLHKPIDVEYLIGLLNRFQPPRTPLVH